MKLPPEALKLLREKVFAQVALVDSKGRPHVSPMWVDVDDEGRVVLNTAEGRVKAKIMKLGATIALTVSPPNDPYAYIFIRGPIVVRTHEGARDVINQMAHKYRGRDFTFKDGEERVTLIVDPELVYVY